ncbi:MULTISPECIES: MgtC/SapB family protein [Mesorhizobium]|uniref:MgtC/SapB family protein n=1 Tax=Mesorhizobium TaxID=68287 RepID=UPI000FCB7689|nr:MULTISPECIES: MgtC/SapB family protein [Mesorhizobium]RVC62181.1 MgtC/SapB family protein [Mesorhizobium sp. M4B.F.Ca.ET.088.02.2.1]MDX8434510.1 MgtC/SapB family protein [Mesorhizobium abyssinicae]RUW73153.1 MgtC/SapB family protein [Mesorhizobium sp. M4B.F.Ca.ET.049.02.1.2]RWC95751.1 MAG: MgtC/SapB family protein [Mesorhizobium sp.]RWF30995.1 MAG: MgtC/SapB family protein [Mesorhizobium sp.]
MFEPLCCDMPLHPGWPDLLARLLLTLLAGFLIGLNREARGHTAGLRTTILVGLAAAIAMIQANMLLDVAGKGTDSFVRMDVLRFPLGVLTGVGFIGGGAILRRGDLVTGVTTAATMWIMTMIGLAFGGGQFGLGAIATVLTLVTLQALKWVDLRIPRDHHAILAVSWPKGSPPDLREMVRPLGYDARFVGMEHDAGRDRFVHTFNLGWKQPDAVEPSMEILAVVGQHCEVERFELISEKAG